MFQVADFEKKKKQAGKAIKRLLISHPASQLCLAEHEREKPRVNTVHGHLPAAGFLSPVGPVQAPLSAFFLQRTSR